MAKRWSWNEDLYLWHWVEMKELPIQQIALDLQRPEKAAKRRLQMLKNEDYEEITSLQNKVTLLAKLIVELNSADFDVEFYLGGGLRTSDFVDAIWASRKTDEFGGETFNGK